MCVFYIFVVANCAMMLKTTEKITLQNVVKTLFIQKFFSKILPLKKLCRTVMNLCPEYLLENRLLFAAVAVDVKAIGNITLITAKQSFNTVLFLKGRLMDWL